MSHAAAKAYREAYTEAQFQADVLRLADVNGWKLKYHTYRSDRSDKGFPDLVLCRLKPRPQVVCLELKSEKGQASPEQIVWIEALNKCPGIEARIARPSDWDSLLELLKRPRVVS